MGQNSTIRVGGVPLNPSKINKPFLENMLKATKKADLSAGKESAANAVKELFEKGEIGEDSFDAIKSFAKELKKEWKADKKVIGFAAANPEEPVDQAELDKARAGLAANAPFLGASTVFVDQLREATALNAVQAIAGAEFGPTAAVAGYAAYANGTTWNNTATRKTQALVDTYKEYLSGESQMTTKGNSVKQVHRQELWKTLTDMTRDAAKSDGAPITAQYYELTSPELIGNLANAAKAGSPLRLNMDVGRLSYPAKDPVTEMQYFEVDDLATKMRTVLQFTSMKGADVGVSIFPSKSLLGSPTDLMHRKVLRVGEQVLMSGMNGNVDSGENIDAGYVVEGPAAKRFTENVARDISNSAGATLEDIWGDRQLKKFDASDLRMGTTGLVAMFDAINGPSEAGTALTYPKNASELEGMAKEAGLDLKSVLKYEEGEYEKTLTALLEEKEPVSLSDDGKKSLMKLIRKGVRSTHTKKNRAALADISVPSGKEVGKTTIDIADQPSEREVLTINAINEAEEFIYVPGFVVTRAVSAAIVARQKEATEAGNPLDIRVTADSGIYPFGGTPNSWGVNFLEDNGIPVRWSMLERSGGHDRKIHAKQLLTDKGEIAGSTNFSKKGMQENWETSAYVRFEGDKESEQLKAQSKAQFEQLWEEDTYPLSTTDLATFFAKDKPEDGHQYFVDTGRAGATRTIISGIEGYEIESGALISRLMERDDVSARRDELIETGYSDGDAALMAAEQVVGKNELDVMLADLPTYENLNRLAERVEMWKNDQAG